MKAVNNRDFDCIYFDFIYFSILNSQMFCFRCTNWFRSLGAITVWLSWISLVLFLRKFPKLGIYVVMFTHIMKTFAQFFTVFALFIVAFGLGFHMLLYEQVSPRFRSSRPEVFCKNVFLKNSQSS